MQIYSDDCMYVDVQPACTYVDVQHACTYVNVQPACMYACQCHVQSACTHVDAQTKISGECAVLFKYLHPYVIAIATETDGREKCQFKMCMLTDTQHSSVLHSHPTLASIDIYIIDTVSGHFVSHIYHRQYKSPVYRVLSENWLLVMLFFLCLFSISNLLFCFCLL